MSHWPYSTQHWQRLRAAKLQLNPLCEYCPKGTRTTAKYVDHKIPIQKGGEVWDMTNLASCCGPCHSRKTAREDKLGAAARKQRPNGGCDANGRPLDPDHWWS